MKKNTHVRFFVIIIFFFSLFISSKSYFKKNSQISEKPKFFSAEKKNDLNKNYENNIVYGGDKNISEIFPEIKNNNLNKQKETFYRNIITGVNSSDLVDLPIEARGVYIFDLKNSREIYGKNAQTKFPLASIAKLMTAVIASENLKKDEIIEISKNAVNEYGESNLSVNEQWRLDDLLNIMLISSSNDAAAAISEKFKQIYGRDIVDSMNKKAKKIGMDKTVFYNSTGLDINKSAGAYGTPKDISILMNYIFKNHPRLFLKTKEKFIKVSETRGNSKNFINTNIVVQDLKNLIGGKTGFTELSGGNFTFIFDAGKENYYTVVLLKSSFSGRFQDAVVAQRKLFVNY